MKKSSKKLLIIFVALIGLFLINSYKVYAETSEITVSNSYEVSKADEVFAIVNRERAKNGLSPLSWDYDLERAAAIRVVETSAYFSHTRPNGNSCFTIIDELGVKTNYSANGENIAGGYSTATSVMNGWMNSPGHRANILNANYNTIGIACVGNTWVQLFGKNNANINSQKYITDGSEREQKFIVKDLYIEPLYKTITMNQGVYEKTLYTLFSLRSSSILSFRTSLMNVVGVSGSTSNSSALVFSDNGKRKFSSATLYLTDFDTYTFTINVAGKSCTINVVGVKPDMIGYTFNAKYYADKYGDLKVAFGYNEAALRNHWQSCGIDEGRQASPIFDPKYYLDNNGDLKSAFGNNYRQALNHFIMNGIGECRKSSPEYWGEYYRNNNGDLSSFSGYKLAIHYYNCGYGEGRKANTGVATKPVTSAPAPQSKPAYNNSWNGDVNRIVFDASFYGFIYGDLRGMSEEGLYSHWINHGIREGRQASIMFDPKYYLENNGDLKAAFGNNYEAALNHFKTCGLKEGRKSSIYFDGRDYLNRYGDLKAAFGNNYARGAEHFLLCGMKEGRIGSSSFNVNNYRKNYGDLNNAFGNDFGAYYRHYLAFGKNEGRKEI